MIKDQMFLFPEYDFFAQKEKKIDFMHLDEIKNSSFTKKKYSDLPKKRYILWKTGGINSYMPDLGPVFPYIYDTLREKLKTIRVKTDNIYPRCHFTYFLKGKRLEIKPSFLNANECRVLKYGRSSSVKLNFSMALSLAS